MLFTLFLIIDLYFLILTVFVQNFIHTEELPIYTGTPTNEGNAKIETKPLTAEIKTEKRSK